MVGNKKYKLIWDEKTLNRYLVLPEHADDMALIKTFAKENNIRLLPFAEEMDNLIKAEAEKAVGTLQLLERELKKEEIAHRKRLKAAAATRSGWRVIPRISSSDTTRASARTIDEAGAVFQQTPIQARARANSNVKICPKQTTPNALLGRHHLAISHNQTYRSERLT